MSAISPTDVALYLTAGAALGALYFLLLLRAVRLHASRAGAIRSVPLYLARLAVAIATFWVIVQEGAMPLLLALLGFVIARFFVQHRMGSD